MGDQHGCFQNIKWVQLEEKKKVESQHFFGEAAARQRAYPREMDTMFWSLLNAESGMLDLDIQKRPPEQLVASALRTDPTEEEVASTMKAMVNAKAVGPDGLPWNCRNSDANKTGLSY